MPGARFLIEKVASGMRGTMRWQCKSNKNKPFFSSYILDFVCASVLTLLNDSALYMDGLGVICCRRCPIPCQILCFLHIDDLKEPMSLVNGYPVASEGIYAVIRKFTTPAKPTSSHFKTKGTLDDGLFLFNTDTMLSDIAVVPELEQDGTTTENSRPILHTTPTKKMPQVCRHTVPIGFQLFHRSLLLSIHNLHSLSRILHFVFYERSFSTNDHLPPVPLFSPVVALHHPQHLWLLRPQPPFHLQLPAPPDAAALACFIKSLAPSTSDCTAAALPDAAALNCFIKSLAPSTSNRTAA
eukprot:jgi/Psemu1/20026/gm1.20026_g